MFVLSVTLTVLLLLEALPSAAAWLIRARAGLARLEQLTRLGLLEGRNLWVASLLGAVHLGGSAALLIRLSLPAAGVAGAGTEAGLSAGCCPGSDGTATAARHSPPTCCSPPSH
jgi:hypothetical protein